MVLRYAAAKIGIFRVIHKRGTQISYQKAIMDGEWTLPSRHKGLKRTARAVWSPVKGSGRRLS